MRLWSLHPVYLDARGLVALWREALLAKKVLEALTRGYTRHPQLIRFRAQPDPLAVINAYLQGVHAEAVRRGYHFDPAKFTAVSPQAQIPVTTGQLSYEFEHLKRKLQIRDPRSLQLISSIEIPQPHPLFIVRPGEVESWEKQLSPE